MLKFTHKFYSSAQYFFPNCGDHLARVDCIVLCFPIQTLQKTLDGGARKLCVY